MGSEQSTKDNSNNLIIKKEKSDEKGTLDDDSLLEFLIKAKNATCQVILDADLYRYGSGFFCKIPYTNNKNLYMNVLLTCEHVLNSNLVYSNNKIKIKVNNEIKNLSLKHRKKWSNKALDYSCIEIMNEDEIDDFYQLDDILSKKSYKNELYLEEVKKHILIFSIMKNGKRGHSNGLIKGIDKTKNYFYHNCNMDPGSSGGVIVNKNNNCVIGIHIGAIKNNNEILNCGLFMHNIIEDIIYQNTKNIINEKNKNSERKIEINESEKFRSNFSVKSLNQGRFEYNNNFVIGKGEIKSRELLECLKRLNEEYKELSRHPINNYGLTIGLIDKNNLLEWKFTLGGAKDTSYKNGVFILKLTFPDSYPKSHPQLKFLTPIYHINVNDRNGEVFFSTINFWKSGTSVRKVLHDLYSIFYWANPDSVFDLCKRDEFMNNPLLYEEKARYFSLRYANPLKSNKFLSLNWDFSFNEDKIIKTLNNDKKNNEKNAKKNNDAIKEDKPYFITDQSTNVKFDYIPYNIKYHQNKNINDYEIINLKFDTGDTILSIRCSLNEKAKYVIDRFKQNFIPKSSILFIYRQMKLVDYKTLKENGVTNGSTIDVIYDVIYA